jgi:hypothetical protein
VEQVDVADKDDLALARGALLALPPSLLLWLLLGLALFAG